MERIKEVAKDIFIFSIGILYGIALIVVVGCFIVGSESEDEDNEE